MDDSSIEPVQVFVRIRPEIPEDAVISELSGSYTRHRCVTGLDGKTLRVDPPDALSGRKNVSAVDSKLYSYDRVFGDDSSQEDIYGSVSHHVRATIRGYNTTIFALGCTGSGKTFTMSGNSSQPGIVPRAISEIFSMIEATAAEEKDVYFYVRLSLVELYNNNFRNLLDFASKELSDRDHLDTTMSHMNMRGSSPSSLHPSVANRSEKIEVRESQTAGVFLAGHNLRIPVTTAQEAFLLIARGNKNRATGATNCNDVSSRSHCILTIHVESRLEPGAEGGTSELRLGKMHLVDLAGSERLKLSGAEGDTLTETQNINLSLTALGDVLAALSHNAKDHSKAHGKLRSPSRAPFAMMPVPYRNSKLTHLLKDSLGGNSKTTMITTICTLSEYYQQTLISLNYASRAKRVKNRSLVNRDVIGDSGIHAVTSEIERLRARLDERSSEFDRLKLEHQRDASENLTLKSRLQELNKVNENEKKQLEAQMSNVIHNQAGQLAAQRQRISTLQTALQDELAMSQNRIAEQEREIKWLKKALDDSAQAVQYPTEQIERMQKVINAWEEQAKNTQSELSQANASADEARLHMMSMRSEFSSLQTERDSLRKELNDWPKREAELMRSLSNEKKEAMEAVSRSEYLVKENAKLKLSISSLSEGSQRLESRISESTARSYQVESELRAQLDKAEKRIIELTMKNEEIEEQNDELRTRLSSTMTAMEKQLLAVVDDSKSSVKQNEFRVEIAEKRAKSMEMELDIFKKKITAVQNDTQEIIIQRDSKISALWAELQDTKSAMDRLVREYEVKQSDDEKMVSDLNSRLAVSEKTIVDMSAAASRKAAEFAASLEARVIEVTELKKRYAEMKDSVSREYEQKFSEYTSSMEFKLNTVLESKDAEIKSIKVSCDDKYKGEIEQLMKQLSELKESSTLAVTELRSKLQLATERAATDAKTISDLRLEYAQEMSAMETVHKNEKKQLEEKYSVDLKEVRESSQSRIDESEAKIRDLYEAHRSALETDLATKIDAIERGHRHQLEVELDKCAENLRKEHNAEMQLLRAQHLQLMREVELKYAQNASVEKDDIVSDMQRAYADKERQLRADLTRSLEEVRSEAASSVREADEKYKKKIQAATNALQAQLNQIENQKQEISKEVEARLASEKEKLTQTTIYAAELQHQAALKAELDSLRVELSTNHTAELSALRAQLEKDYDHQLRNAIRECKEQALIEHSLALDRAVSDLKNKSDSVLEARLRELKEKHDQELDGLRTDHSMQIEHLTSSFQHQMSSAKLDAELSLRNEFNESMEALRRDLAEKNDSEIKSAVADRNNELSELLHVREKQLQEERDTVMLKCENRIRELEQSHTQVVAMLEKKCAEDLERVSREFSENRDKFDLEMKMARENHEFSLKEMEKNMIEGQRSDLQRKLDELEMLHTAALQSQKERFAEQLANELALQSSSIKKSNDEEIRVIRSQLTNLVEEEKVRREEYVATLTDKHASELKLLQEEMQNRITRLEAEKFEQLELSRDQILLLHVDHRKSIEEAEIRFKQQLANAVESQRQEFESRQKEYDALTEASVLSRITEAREKERAQCQLDIANLNAAKEAMMSSLQDKASAEVSNALSSQLNVLLSKHNEEVKSLHERYENMRSDLELKAHVAEIERRDEAQVSKAQILDLETSVQELTEALADEKTMHASDVKNAEMLHMSQMESLRADLEQNFKKDAEVKALNYEALIQELTTKYENELSALRLEFSETLKEKETDLSAELLKERQLLLSELEAEKYDLGKTEREKIEAILLQHQISLQDQAVLYEAKLEALQQECSHDMNVLQGERAKCILDLEATHTSKLIAMEKQLMAAEESLTKLKEEETRCKYTSDELRREIAEIKVGHTEQYQKMEDFWKADMENCIAAQKAQYDEDLDKELRRIVCDLDTKVAQLQSFHEEEHKKLVLTISILEKKVAEESENKKMLQQDFAEEKAALFSLKSQEINKIVASMQQQFESEKAVLINRHQAQLDEMRTQSIAELQKVQTTLENEKEEYAIQKLKTSASETSEMISDMSRQCAAALVKAETEYAERLAAISFENDQIEMSLKKEYSRDKAETVALIQQKHESQLDSLRSQHEAEVCNIRFEAESTLKLKCAEHEENVSLLTAQHAQELGRLKDLHDEALMRYKEATGVIAESSRIQELQGQIKELKNMMQCAYDESKMSGPKMNELHDRFLELFKITSTSLSHVDDEMRDSSAFRHTVNRLIDTVDGKAKVDTRCDEFSFFDTGRDNTSIHEKGVRHNHRVFDVDHESFDGMRRSIDSHRSVTTSASWATKGASDRPSPTDQLIAAILDGDIQGIRATVRSKGDTLHSPFWIDISKNILPLHRAISGLHFHGSETRLVSTIETLIQLGCNVKAVDHMGNTAVHKAIQVCTSSSVKLVLECLLSKGASATVRAHSGDAPLHTECRRLRIASPEVVACLIAHGADPSTSCQENIDGTVLTTDLYREEANGAYGGQTCTPLSIIMTTASTLHGEYIVPLQVQSRKLEKNLIEDSHQDDKLSSRRGVYRSWVIVAGILLRAGAGWDKNWRQKSSGYSQLHLLMQAFPPPRDQAVAYRTLMLSAIKAGLSPMSCNNGHNRSALHILCMRLGTVTMETYPDAGNVLHALLHACFDEVTTSGIGKLGVRADFTGRTIFQIKEVVLGSWLSASEKLLREAVSRMTGTTNTRGALLELQHPQKSTKSKPVQASGTHINYDNRDCPESMYSSVLKSNFNTAPQVIETEEGLAKRNPGSLNAFYGGAYLRMGSSNNSTENNFGRSSKKFNSDLLPPR